jgi:soluble lytic murein transglycosylase-like protein
VPPALLLAVKNAGEKSGPTAVSGKGATGVMQFMEGTAKEMGLADRTDPVASIDAGARYLKKLHDAYGSWDAAVAHYNGGGAQAAIVRGGGRRRPRRRWATWAACATTSPSTRRRTRPRCRKRWTPRAWRR